MLEQESEWSGDQMKLNALFGTLVCLFFGIGYLYTYQEFSVDGAEYFLYTLLSLCCCEVLLWRLNRSIGATLPIWILLAIFGVGYFLQFFLLVLDPTSTGQIVVTQTVGVATLLRVYRTTVLSFSAFCITSYVLLGQNRRARSAQAPQELRIEEAKSLARLLLFIIPSLEVVLGYVSWSTQIAVLGAEMVTLPFRLAGVVYYMRATILPALILLLIWTTDRYHLRKSFNAGIVLLLFYGVSETLLRSSRSSLLFALLGLIFLLTVTCRLTRRRLQVLLGGVFVALLLFPIVTAYRYARAASDSFSIVSAIREGLVAVPDTDVAGDILSVTGHTLIFRVTGLDSLLEIVDSDIRPLGLFHMFDVTAVFNAEIMNLPPDSVTSTAPSLVGWFYLVGGNMFVLVGIVAFVIGVQFVWNALRFAQFWSHSVAQALFLLLLVYACSDGVLDRMGWLVFMTGVSLTFAELLIRWSVRRSRFSRRLRSRELTA